VFAGSVVFTNTIGLIYTLACAVNKEKSLLVKSIFAKTEFFLSDRLQTMQDGLYPGCRYTWNATLMVRVYIFGLLRRNLKIFEKTHYRVYSLYRMALRLGLCLHGRLHW
jgi:hypothetical protein